LHAAAYVAPTLYNTTVQKGQKNVACKRKNKTCCFETVRKEQQDQWFMHFTAGTPSLFYKPYKAEPQKTAKQHEPPHQQISRYQIQNAIFLGAFIHAKGTDRLNYAHQE
jgi:hypothetical protein